MLNRNTAVGLIDSPRQLLGLHPATWLVCWVAFLFFVARCSIMGLAICCLILLPTAQHGGGRPLLALRRITIVIVSGLGIYAFATPGMPLWPAVGAYSPTVEGLSAGIQQILRLVAAVTSLAFIMAKLGPDGMLTAVDWLVRPLCWVEYAPDRLIVRLCLTLHYIESAGKKSFMELLSQLHDPVAENPNRAVAFQRQPIRLRDGFFFLLVLGALLAPVSP